MEAKLTGVDRRAVAGFLGCQKTIPADIANSITACEARILEIAAPKLTYRILDRENVYLNTQVLQGQNIRTLLENCAAVVLFAATLGTAVDRWLTRLQVWDMAQAVIGDACAAGAIENVCDHFCADMTAQYGPITPRFSPGYGDLPLSVQVPISHLLDMPKTVGISWTDGGLMLPQKSVTALFGIRKPVPSTDKKNDHAER